ncbi:MAG: hypothetical protein ACTSRG_07510 [Candidatus Helarchaeota archaeon]
MSSHEKKNIALMYLPFIVIIGYLIVILFSNYFYLPSVLGINVSDAWLSFLPLVIFLIIFVIIEWKNKLIQNGGKNA